MWIDIEARVEVCRIIVLFSLLLYVEHFFFYFSHENLKPYDIPT